MTLDRLRPVANAGLKPFVRGANAIGLTPNLISLLAFLCAVGAAWTFFLAGEHAFWYLVGAALVFANGWLDLLDGAIARDRSVDSPRGDLLDHVLDRYADIVIIAGLAAGIDQYALGFLAITGVLMTSYLGTQTIAVGLERAYGGVIGRADRLALVGVTALLSVPYSEQISGLTLVGWLLVVLTIVGHLTALQRFLGAWRRLD